MKSIISAVVSLASVLHCAAASSSSSSSSSSTLRKSSKRQLATEAYIFNTVADGAAQGWGDKVGKSCSTDDRWVR